MHDAVGAALKAVNEPDMVEVANDQPTVAEVREALAIEIFDLNAEIAKLTAIYDAKKANFLANVGASFSLELAGYGKIISTAETKDRPSGNLATTFNLEKYVAAAPKLKAQLETLGIVKLEGTTIKGQKSIIKVTPLKAS